MIRVSRRRYLSLFSVGVRAPIEAHFNEEGTDGAVCYENQDFGSSEFGARSHLPYGPRWSTLKRLEDTEAVEPGRSGRPLGDVPSRFRYPAYYWKKPRDDNDVQWEALQDAWDDAHPVSPPLSRDEEGADRFVQSRLAHMRAFKKG